MKTQLQAIVNTYNNAGITFTGTEASAVVSAVRAHQDIKAKGTSKGAPKEYPVQIPYTSVMGVLYKTVQVESTTEDDNCKVQTPAEEAVSMTIKNNEISSVMSFTLTLGDTSINGTYGDFTFTDGVAQAQIPAGGQLELTGIDDGTSYTISGDQIGSTTDSPNQLTGTTPATVILKYQIA